MLMVGAPAQAASLGLTQAYPDFVLAAGQTYSYDGSSKTLTIDGLISSYSALAGGTQYQVRNSSTSAPLNDPVNGSEAFSLTATFDASGNVVSGSFYIDGVVADNSFPFPGIYNGFTDPSGHLLAGDLLLSGVSDDGSATTNGALFEFRFGNAEGYITDPLNRTLGEPFAGQQYSGGGMILTLNDGVMLGGGGGLAANDFFESTDWVAQDWTGTGFGDVFVPVPAAAWLFGSALGLLGWLKRRKV